MNISLTDNQFRKAYPLLLSWYIGTFISNILCGLFALTSSDYLYDPFFVCALLENIVRKKNGSWKTCDVVHMF